MHRFPVPISMMTFVFVATMLHAQAWAHVPYIEVEDFTTTSSFVCLSAEQSIAVYSWLESSSDADYYRVHITTPTLLYAGVIVPVFDQYSEFRPQFAVVGPGLPPATKSIPIETEPQSGVLLLQDDGKKPRKQFYEPFGNKSYYQGPEVSTLLQAGEYTLVYWDPEGRIGDYVAIVGKREVWNAKDILRASMVTPMIRRGEELHLQRTRKSRAEREKIPMSKENDEIVLFDSESDAIVSNWRVVNDTVMGGISASQMEQSKDGGVAFTGNLSLENNGGFASVRGPDIRQSLGDFKGIAIRVKGDGKIYKCGIRTDDRFDGVYHQASFKTKKGEWEEVRLPLADFVPTYHGRQLSEEDRMKPGNIKSLSFLIADKQEGTFRLEIDWIKAYY
ncbi:CIA30 family protein [Candidatus Sumerlaeota bacterium]